MLAPLGARAPRGPRAADVEADALGPRLRGHVEEAARAAACVEHPFAFHPLLRPARLREEPRLGEARAVDGVELLGLEEVPLVAERRGVVLLRHEARDAGPDRVDGPASHAFEFPALDLFARAGARLRVARQIAAALRARQHFQKF